MVLAKGLMKPLLVTLTVCLLVSALAVSIVAIRPHQALASGSGNLATKMVSITTVKGTFGFKPKKLKITVGTTVTWKNNTTVTHTVTSDTGLFDSGPIAPGGTFSFTFTTSGTFKYHCSIHAFMHGSVVVH
jgi:plastocyanin